ncbi:amino acid ABC transporter [Cereibacter changlensis JA139]|uniref:Amino acid ABC transporter n=2 Tax=Cereibacter changlensis TaxID=402884 RepID=A0A2T4JZU1_9RHOB|nr:transporter substrate-binding domain-containing protein [Cereibacter changlensis]PTE23273.1 amino acid ABC transporter [Cereibacter changlensis JA139]PZX55115.1 amino acid ABC transporter substrate-binding protein (PAAT family) [Cereibacter changlensis]
MKTTILTLTATLLLGSAALAEPVKVGIAAEPYPPFASPDASGNWVGWEVDMIGAVCAAAELECEVTPVAWDGIIPALTSGQIDAIMASLSITEERLKTIDFSDKYYNTPTVIIGAKGDDFAATPEGLEGKIIGVQVSTVHQAYAQAHFADAAAEIKLYQTQDEANQDLVAGRIDATQADSIALDAFLASEAGACCDSKGAVADDPAILGLGVGVGLRKGDEELKAKFNAGIAKVVEDGTYEKVSAPYFASSIYGG